MKIPDSLIVQLCVFLIENDFKKGLQNGIPCMRYFRNMFWVALNKMNATFLIVIEIFVKEFYGNIHNILFHQIVFILHYWIQIMI